ncbi:MAG: ABC transporter permease [Gemmatimonadaceae bacterium]
MSRTKGILARVRAIFRSRAAEARMEEEFRFHLEMETQRLIGEGLAPDEARRRSIIRFGGLDAHRETMRDERGARWLDDFVGDLRYAMRAMRRSPGFAIATAVTLGIGIGVNGIVFGYVNSILLRPVPARAAHELVALFNRDTKTGQIHQLGYEDLVDFRDRSGAFSGLAAMTGMPLNLVVPNAQGTAAGDMVWGEMVTENFFSVLEMPTAAGRFFTAADAPQGANPFVVLSYESWRKRFQSDPAVVGRVLRINGTEFTVTGVAPRGFRGMRMFGFWPEMWVPIGMHGVIQPGSTRMLLGRGGGSLLVVGRMRPGFDHARTEATAIAFGRQLETAYPASNANVSAIITPAKVGFENPTFVKPVVLVLSSALGIFASLLVLLIICANLANLQLARAAARAREFGIRLSLGCPRGRLTRQLVVESATLALPGLAVALLVLRLGVYAEPFLTPRLQFQVGLDARADMRVMLFTAAIALAAIVLFGLVPAMRAGRSRLTSSLSSVLGAALARGTGRPSRVRSTLVVSQLALSVILLVGGTLFVRSLILARTSDVGFDPRDRALISVNVGLQGYDEHRGARFYDEVLSRARQLPGVVAASFAFPAPFDTYNRGARLYVEGLANSRDGTIGTDVSFVGDDFVRALGLRLQEGRDFTMADSAGAPPVMIVSRSLATRLWPGKDPLGQRARRGSSSGVEVTVVGVLADAKFVMLGNVGDARVYMPVKQRYRDWETLVVHTRGGATRVIPHLRDIIAAIDPALPTFGATTMGDAVASGFATSRSAAAIAGFFGLLALLIASVGLYAVVAGSVAERTREMGVRLALGSTPKGIVGHLMRGGAKLGIIGLAIGLAGALAVARTMAGLLFGLSPSDPVTFTLVPLALGAVVLVATYLPARRAAKLDPVAALRSD